MHSQTSLPLAHGAVASPSTFSFSSEPEPGGVEEALLQLVQDHHHASLRLRDATGEEGRDQEGSACGGPDGGGGERRRVQEAFVNEKRIEYEIRALAATIARFSKQTDQSLSVTHSMNTAIKEIGDFENWMKIMEFDCKSITAAIHNIHQA
ncbi:hypothetical protein DVH24_038407 [Malus domestica]|uniref:Biogenesis of lysosome-related organelles complex 1 subunit 1 n=1 Tax=Malus domestica TaxID=3750 RepID=A0A498KF95_MALDO|nr:hypothetical protein DVH24_038407 [Malus domestica]